ncbi:hypothetical protein HID58_094733 [Brassica napus]|uniref:Secreted protein n=1 Tax=Brassica napus TaxID=3708 RepID=A0ABQ7X668_BRANA|nr:hypothetical protein HID58_094733 [Brassica napus]
MGARFTPNHSRITLCILCITAACWHRVSRCLFPRYRHCFFSGKEVDDHPLGPATDHALVAIASQLANQTRAPPRADSSFCSSAYGVLAAVSQLLFPPKGRFLRRVTHLTRPTLETNTSRPTCMFKHAASEICYPTPLTSTPRALLSILIRSQRGSKSNRKNSHSLGLGIIRLELMTFHHVKGEGLRIYPVEISHCSRTLDAVGVKDRQQGRSSAL